MTVNILERGIIISAIEFLEGCEFEHAHEHAQKLKAVVNVFSPIAKDLGIELAWGIIANAHGGDWSQETDEWRSAAERWRDTYYSEGDAIALDVERVTVGPEGGDRIKDWEQLRYTLAHLWNAIDHLVDGFPESAAADLVDCQDAIFWDNTDRMRADLDGKTPRKVEPMQHEEQATETSEAQEKVSGWLYVCPSCQIGWRGEEPNYGTPVTCPNIRCGFVFTPRDHCDQ